MGSKIKADSGKFIIEGLSTIEFGKIDYCLVYLGIVGDHEEVVYLKYKNISSYTFNANFTVSIEKKSYFRVEIVNVSGGKKIFSLSNPIWLL